MNEWVTKLTELAGRRKSKARKGQGNKDYLNINTKLSARAVHRGSDLQIALVGLKNQMTLNIFSISLKREVMILTEIIHLAKN